MASTDADAPAPDAGSNLAPAYIRVLVVEVIVLLALYWFSRHFA